MLIKKLHSFLLHHEYLIWILCLCAFLRLPSLLEPYWYGDEGIYLTLGQAVRQGLHLYRDIHDNKPPLLYLMAALTGSVFWFRFFLLLWNSVAIILFERLSRVLFKETDADGILKILGVSFPVPRWSTLATLLFALLPFFAEGAIANGEIFMIMPVVAGVLLLWQTTVSKQQTAKIILAGICFAIAFLIKVPALFDAAAAGFFFFIVLRDWKKPLASGLLPLVSFSLAFLLPILLSVVYYSVLGVGKQYIASAFAQNIGYLSSWASGTHSSSTIAASGLKIRAGILLLATVILSFLAKKQGKTLTFLLLWLGFSLFGALLSERPYPHYLIQVVPPFALLIAYGLKLILSKEAKRIPKILSISLCIMVLAYAVYSIRFWYYPLLPYYKNYVSFVTGQKSKQAYLAHFDARLPQMYETAAYVANRTTQDERIFAWGDVPMVYALSRRLPPGRYTSSYHIKDFGGAGETAAAILAKKPKFIVLDSLYEAPFPELATILTDDYIVTRTFGSFVVYKYFPHQVQ